MQNIQGAVAFITGSASGIGLGMAKVFSQAGMRVVIADIRQEAIDSALRQFPAGNPGVVGVQLDVADRAAYVRAADAAEKAFGKINVLVNNAGVGIVGSLLTATYADWDWDCRSTWAVLLTAFKLFCRVSAVMTKAVTSSRHLR